MSEYSVIDATFHHPFTAIVTGPSGCGKTTFVKDLILQRKYLISGEEIQFVLIYIGTSLDENPIFKYVQQTLPDLVKVIEVKKLYEGNQKVFEDRFAQDFENVLSNLGYNGCVIFDDMMLQLSRANILTDLFSKISSHKKLSVIQITQNLFLRGKQAQEHRTCYTSCHHLVLFKQPMDTTVFQIIAKRVHSSAKYVSVYEMLIQVADRFRYIIVSGNIGRDPKLKYTSDIFNRMPVPYQRVFYPSE